MPNDLKEGCLAGADFESARPGLAQDYPFLVSVVDMLSNRVIPVKTGIYGHGGRSP